MKTYLVKIQVDVGVHASSEEEAMQVAINNIDEFETARVLCVEEIEE